MANTSFRSSLDAAGVASAVDRAPDVDVVDALIDAAKVLVDTSDTATDLTKAKVDLADTALDAAKVLSAALETDAAAADGLVDTAIAAVPDDTDVIAAIAVLQADGASPTEAHVDALQTVWDIFKTAFDTAATELAAAKVATAAIETDAAAADAALDTTVTASQLAQTTANDGVTASQAAQAGAVAAVTGSQAGQAAVSGGLVVAVDLSAVPTVSKLRKIFNEIMIVAIGSGRMTA